jgi:gliding motility-associated-like protein
VVQAVCREKFILVLLPGYKVAGYGKAYKHTGKQKKNAKTQPRLLAAGHHQCRHHLIYMLGYRFLIFFCSSHNRRSRRYNNNKMAIFLLKMILFYINTVFVETFLYLNKPFAVSYCLFKSKQYTGMRMKNNYHYPFKCSALLLLAFICCYSHSYAQIAVVDNQTAVALAQKLVGTGVIVTNPTLTCAGASNGIFVTTSSNLGLDSGVILCNGHSVGTPSVPGANSPGTMFASQSMNTPGDTDLTNLAANGQQGHDACILEFDFVPAGDTIKFDYVFGSEEYTSYTCTQFNDVFGFFISGPGFPARRDIALVPGTLIPVAVNSVNNGPTGGGMLATCQAMGPGSPFSAYYRNNSLGTTVVYDGLTTVLTAIARVTPCQTYHLKLGVEDLSDGAFDSGVWLRAGSLNSISTAINSVGGGGLLAPVPYCVRGCLPGKFILRRPHPKTTPLTIKFAIQGTAANGVDYTTIADSVVIQPNDSTAVVNIFGLPIAATGPKTVKLFVYSPYSCSGNATPIIDSATLTIYDSLYEKIISHDTAICRYKSVQINTLVDSLLTLQWTPALGLSDPTIANPIASPSVTTTYTLVGTLAQSGCTPAVAQTTITVYQPPVVTVTPLSRIICLGDTIHFNATVSPANQTYHFKWGPSTFLSNDSIPNPINIPTTSINYILAVNPNAQGCTAYDTIRVRVLPADFTLNNHDTAICKGATVSISASGDPAFTYTWTPSTGVANDSVLVTSIKPDTSMVYSVRSSFPGCTDKVHSFAIDVQPNAIVVAGADRKVCEWDTLHMHPTVVPKWYQHYKYSWTPARDIDQPNAAGGVTFIGDTTVTLIYTVTTPAGCKGADSIHILVHPGNFGLLISASDTSICPNDSVHIIAAGAKSYAWHPGTFFNDSNSATPIVKPLATGDYTSILTDSSGCHDTLMVHLSVHPGAVVNLGADSVTIYPGESYQLSATGNCSSYSWFPPLGLSAANISDPVANPGVNTMYIVTGATEWGCTAIDSIEVLSDPNTLLALPNAFAPGNGTNNQLKIIKRGIASLNYFRIFNRWGVQVFSTHNIDDGWDGTYNGTPQPLGVYIYMVEAVTNTGIVFTKQGNITLLR